MTTRHDPTLSSWERILVGGGSALGLVITRAFVFTVVMVDVSRMPIRSFDTSASSTWAPIKLLGITSVPRPTDTSMSIVSLVTMAAALIALVPRVGRVGAPFVFVGYTWLTLVANSFGKIDHSRQPTVVMVACLVFAAAPTWDEVSRWQFRWPVQLCRLTLAVTLAAASMSKLRNSGLGWVTSDHLRNIITVESARLTPSWTPLGHWIASEPLRWQVAAAGAIVGELALLVAIGTRRMWWGRLAVAIGASTVAGIALVMGLATYPLMVLPVVFVECDRLTEAWATGGRSRFVPLAAPTFGCAALGVARLQVDDQFRFVLPVAVVLIVIWAAALRPVTATGRGRSGRPGPHRSGRGRRSS